MDDVVDAIEAIARDTSFCGVVRVDHGDGGGDRGNFCRAYGMANRSYAVPNTVDTQFGMASGVKGLTALTVVSLIEAGAFSLATTARTLLGNDLPLISNDVTIEQLLGHRSGIGDYLDEDSIGAITDYVMPVPVHELDTTEHYLSMLEDRVAKSEPDQQFAYNNSGYVLLALLAERATGASFYDLVSKRVCEPAGMTATAFLRSDELGGNVALGYLAETGPRSNVLHLPVRGSGDGGLYSTAADVRLLWTAFFAGKIVSPRWVETMVRPRSDVPRNSMRYGLGFWLHESRSAVMLEGYDAGVSFRSVHEPHRDLTHTVISNTSSGAWPITKRLDALLSI